MKMLGDKIDLRKQRKTGLKKIGISNKLYGKVISHAEGHGGKSSAAFFKTWYKLQHSKAWKRKKGTII
jgi:hypothetical protein